MQHLTLPESNSYNIPRAGSKASDKTNSVKKAVKSNGVQQNSPAESPTNLVSVQSPAKILIRRIIFITMLVLIILSSITFIIFLPTIKCSRCIGDSCSATIFGPTECDCSKFSHGGKFCTVDKCLDFDENVCKNGGFCNANSGTALCDCSWSSHGGEACVVDKCLDFDDSVCQNGGFCNADSGTAQCDCSNSNYDGEFCTIDKCDYDNPCQNGGVCSVNSTNVICDCSNSEYGGPYCMPSICDENYRQKHDLGSFEDCKLIKKLNLRFNPLLEAHKDSMVSIPYLGDAEYVEEIDLFGHQIKSLNSRTFENNFRLKKLNLNFNSITELSDDSFSKLTELAYLYLFGSPIYTIEERLFKNNNKLVELDLGHTQIKTIPPKTFHNLVNLEILDLQDNDLTNVPVSLFRNNKKLKYLDLENNNLSEENKKELRAVYGDLTRGLFL